MFNTLVYNPAYAGSKEYLSVVAIYRDQWFNWSGGGIAGAYDGRPLTQTFSMHAAVGDRIGLGLSVINDRVGVRGTTEANLHYAYRMDFGNGKLALGLQAGMMNWNADWEELAYKDPRHLDEAFAGQNPSIWLPTFGAGLYYSNERFYVGISSPHMAGFSLRDSISKNVVRRWAKIYQHFYISVGAAIPLKEKDLIFKPSILIKSVGLFSDFFAKGDEIRTVGAPTAFDVNLSFLFFEKLWLGAGFRSAFAAFSEQNSTKSSHASIDALLALQFKTGLRLGFAYDYPLNEINNYTAGSFEIMMGWDFYKKIDSVQSPRYFF